MWRSLVAHLNGVQEVASSNLAAPTTDHLTRVFGCHLVADADPCSPIPVQMTTPTASPAAAALRVAIRLFLCEPVALAIVDRRLIALLSPVLTVCRRCVLAELALVQPRPGPSKTSRRSKRSPSGRQDERRSPRHFRKETGYASVSTTLPSSTTTGYVLARIDGS